MNPVLTRSDMVKIEVEQGSCGGELDAVGSTHRQ